MGMTLNAPKISQSVTSQSSVSPVSLLLYVIIFIIGLKGHSDFLTVSHCAPLCPPFSSYSVVFRYSFYRLRANEMEDGFDTADLASVFLVYHVKVQSSVPSRFLLSCPTLRPFSLMNSITLW